MKYPVFKKSFIVFAHRGASGSEPENTLRSFQKALELGSAWMELDVQNVQNRLLVFHDARLGRTTNGTGRLAEKSVDALRELDAGKGEKIPYLREVFDLVDRRACLNVELKGRGTAALTVDLIDLYVRDRRWTYDHFIVSSFIRDELKTVKRLQPRIRIGFLYRGRLLIFPKRFVRRLGPYSVHVRKDRVRTAWVKSVQSMGMKVFVYTVNEPEDAERLRLIGVDGIFTDFPERFP
jgi:glycerophosphoryl diester phosphodiesterase